MNVGIFLDRDGTIIKDKGHLGKKDGITLVKNAKKGLVKLSKLNAKIIIVSNQSGIARGLFTEKDCRLVNKECIKRLGNKVRIDMIYFCPHFPEGSVDRYKVECKCRKPKAGMLIRAAKRFNIDLKKSFIIGDSMRDMAAGWLAKAKTVLVLTGITTRREIRNRRMFSKRDIDLAYDGKIKSVKLAGPVDYIANDLLDAYSYIKRNMK